MICKWCGETVKVGAKTCRRCKRELPALSDCGGFYDLVPKDAPIPSPIPSPISEPQQPAQAPVRPVLPQRNRSNPVINVLLVLSVVMAVISLILTISLSGKLADAREEAMNLRDQLKSREDTSESQPAAPNINGLGEKDPERTDESDEIRILLEDGLGETRLNDEQNAQLNSGILHISLCLDAEDEPMLTFTLQRRSVEEGAQELFLQITDAGEWVIHSIEWRGSSQIELPVDGIENLLPSQPDATPEAVTESSKPIDELDEDSLTCTLIGVDEKGEELTITISNIVIE